MLRGATRSCVPTHMEDLLILPLHDVNSTLQLGDGPVPLCKCFGGSLLGVLALLQHGGCRMLGTKAGDTECVVMEGAAQPPPQGLGWCGITASPLQSVFEAQGCTGSRIKLCLQLLLGRQHRVNISCFPLLPQCIPSCPGVNKPIPIPLVTDARAIPSCSCRLFTFASKRWLCDAVCFCSSWYCRVISGSQGEDKKTNGGNRRDKQAVPVLETQNLWPGRAAASGN